MGRHRYTRAVNGTTTTAQRLLIMLGALPVAVALSLFTVLMLANLLLTYVPNARFEQAAATAVSTGVLPKTFPAFQRHSFAWPRYNGSDCLVLTMVVVDPPATRLQKAVSPVERIETLDYCERLRLAIADPRHMGTWYHRYIHGYVTTTGILLTALSFENATRLLYGANLCAAGLLILFGLRGGGADRVRGGTYAALGAGALLFTGMHSFGWSVAFGFGDLILLLFLLWACANSPVGVSERRLTVAAAAFGALVAAFEFLTGHAPVAIGLLLFVLGLEAGSAPDKARRRVPIALASFMVAFAAMFVLKLLLVAAVFTPAEIGAAGGRLLSWTAADNWQVAAENEATLAMLGTSSEQIKSVRLFAYLFALAKMVYHSPYIIFGSLALGAAIMALLPAFTAALLARRVIVGEQRVEHALLLAPFAIVFLWHFIFVSHSVVHNTFMNRTLAWLGVLSLVFGVREFAIRRAARSGLETARPSKVG